MKKYELSEELLKDLKVKAGKPPVFVKCNHQFYKRIFLCWQAVSYALFLILAITLVVDFIPDKLSTVSFLSIPSALFMFGGLGKIATTGSKKEQNLGKLLATGIIILFIILIASILSSQAKEVILMNVGAIITFTLIFFMKTSS